MGRSRVFSFMSQFSNKDHKNSPPASPTTADPLPPRQPTPRSQPALPNSPNSAIHQNVVNPSPQPRPQRARAESNPIPRPLSMVQTYQPPLMEVNEQTLEELQPIFTFLNSHANKLYQEGYFLKLNDQDTQGRPNADRTWTECFAQLVGTVLSLWDAAELDAAGHDGEVLPTFINLTDASIKMIEALPTRSNDDQPLQNVLSISTAGKNRYLLHFNSHHSLIQWTAGIRLAMYEHTTLQEAYTGALIGGKGKGLNNIVSILEHRRARFEDWVRVRFGAGTPWRRCWCVVSPPDEKEYNKLQKDFTKNKSAYDRSRPPVLKGSVKFYESRKITKKSRPIATITDAYSAFAIYPQSKSLIDSSTLVKLEGTITIHSSPPLLTEGFVFVMPEVHPAVSGFEMLLRWLFPVFDTFGLYGRPNRLVADSLDPRSLMFAMPKDRRVGYLEILDVSTLILTDGSQAWKEIEWRKKMKELTARRMTTMMERRSSRYSSRRNTRSGFHPGAADAASIRSSPSVKLHPRSSIEEGPFPSIPRTDSAPPGASSMTSTQYINFKQAHFRSISEARGFDGYENAAATGSPNSQHGRAPPPPLHKNLPMRGGPDSNLKYTNDMPPTPERVSSEDENPSDTPVRELHDLQAPTRPAPVAAPPAFAHAPGSLPISKPLQSPELRRANSRMSTATLAQMAGVNGIAHAAGTVGHGQPMTAEDQQVRERLEASGNRSLQDNTESVHNYANTETKMNNANVSPPFEGTVGTDANRLSTAHPLPSAPGDARNPLQTLQRGHAVTSSTDSTLSKSSRTLSIARKPLPTSPRSSLQVAPASQLRASEYSIDSYYEAAPVAIDSERSTPVRKPVERRDPDKPRPGVMKTAGNTEMGTTNSVATGEPIVPDFDFGPTVNLASDKTFQLQIPTNESSSETKQGSGQIPQTPGHHRNEFTDSNAVRNVAWQPAAKSKPSGDGRGLTPEQFVQQQVASIPSHGHTRQSSSNMLRTMTPDPKSSHVRMNSGDFQRPSSRSADNLLKRSSQHMPAAGGGLVGAIEAREKEKKELKQGINSQAVRQAIVQQQRNSAVYEQRNSPVFVQGQMAPNFHQQTQQFVQQQSQFSRPQFPQAQQQYSPQAQFIPQAYSPMSQPQIGQAFGYTPSPVGYTQSPVDQQYHQGYFPGQGPSAYPGPGQGY